MSDKEKKFHSFAIQSSLFKGHSDWYFSFLKSERIAHVISILSEQANGDEYIRLKVFAESAALLPPTIAHLAADDIDLPQVLAEIFSLMASTRLLVTENTLSKETGYLLVAEYEALAEKLDAAARLSPFVTSDDFLIQSMTETPRTELPPVATELHNRNLDTAEKVKDISKGHSQTSGRIYKGHNDRLKVILMFVQSHNGVSIKDICQMPDPLIRNCSEKTIQRELSELINQGHIRRVGERRWSLYEPISEA